MDKKEPMTKAISVRVSEEEYIRFKEIAAESGCTPPQLLKMWINNTDKGVFRPSGSENYNRDQAYNYTKITLCMVKNNIYDHTKDMPMKKYTFKGKLLYGTHDFVPGVSDLNGGKNIVVRDFGLADNDLAETVSYWSRHALYKDKDREKSQEKDCYILLQEYGLWDHNSAVWTVNVSRLKYFSKYDDIRELVRPYINARDDFGIRYALSDIVSDTNELEEYF